MGFIFVSLMPAAFSIRLDALSDTVPLYLSERYIIFPANGEAKQLDFYLYAVSIPQLSAKVKALVDKIKSRPGAQLQGEELRNWKERTKYHQQD